MLTLDQLGISEADWNQILAAGRVAIARTIGAKFSLKTWTVFTTQAVWYLNEGRSGAVRVTNVAQYDFGDFKGLRGKATATLQIVDSEGDKHICQYETGKPAMGPVYALMTLCAITRDA